MTAVYNKSDKLDNEFRTPELDFLIGEDNTEVIYKEENIKMILDLKKVYFCTKLHFERKRICSKYIKKD